MSFRSPVEVLTSVSDCGRCVGRRRFGSGSLRTHTEVITIIWVIALPSHAKQRCSEMATLKVLRRARAHNRVIFVLFLNFTAHVPLIALSSWTIGPHCTSQMSCQLRDNRELVAIALFLQSSYSHQSEQAQTAQ